MLLNLLLLFFSSASSTYSGKPSSCTSSNLSISSIAIVVLLPFPCLCRLLLSYFIFPPVRSWGMAITTPRTRPDSARDGAVSYTVPPASPRFVANVMIASPASHQLADSSRLR